LAAGSGKKTAAGESIMTLIASLLVALVALLHFGFFVLESILWTRPVGRRIFGLSEAKAADTAGLALNQGLYNLFLAAGLVWGLVAGDCAFAIKLFFLACVIVAGIVGAVSVKRSILWIQAMPAALALACVVLAR
jgi:putative membrane protein